MPDGTLLSIPDSVYYINRSAFQNCTGLRNIIIPNSVTTIGGYAFQGCTGLRSVTIPNSMTGITSYMFSGCTGLNSITIPKSVTSIGDYAFYGCSGLNSITIPNTVTSIGLYAFQGCTGLESVTIPNSVTHIDNWAFPNSAKLYATRGSNTMLALWGSEDSYEPYEIYEIGGIEPCPKPTLTLIDTTQSTVTFKIEDYNNNYRYKINEVVVDNPQQVKVTGMAPEESWYVYLYASCKDSNNWWYEIGRCNYTTAKISPTLNVTKTASSFAVTPSFIKGDANVTSQVLITDNKQQDVRDGCTYTLSGLKPSTEYAIRYEIHVNGKVLGKNFTLTTEQLRMETQKPKVVSTGNVIVAAETNLDELETNVGFEWRRSDWTDDFESNSGGAYLYGGTMEGYIRNLYTEKLWKYRPYYESADGMRYYGEWMGIDPTNTSYFEPTVHTYASIQVQGNSASVKGYAMRGTDNVTQQGFKYWKTSGNTRAFDANTAFTMATDIPADAQTVTASGQVMTATLTDLEYETDYTCVAFVTTSEGETFYGEQQTFRTEEAPTGIGYVALDGDAAAERTVIGYYNLQGQRIPQPQRGVNIIRYSDGTSQKILER